MTIHLIDKLGKRVEAGEGCARLVPGPSLLLQEGHEKDAKRLIRVRTLAKVDEVEESANNVAELIFRAVAVGDHRGSARLTAGLICLLEPYVRGFQGGVGPSIRAGTQHPSQYVVDAPPAVSSILSGYRRAMATADSAVAVRLLLDSLRRLAGLQITGYESINLVVSGTVCTLLGPGPFRNMYLESLFGFAELALDLDDQKVCRVLMNQLGTAVATAEDEADGFVLRVAADIVALAVWKDYLLSREMWGWYQGLETPNGSWPKLLGTLEIGAASLLAGQFSTASETALAIAEHPDRRLVQGLVHNPVFAQQEQRRLDLLGNLLGNDAEYALGRFADFAEVLNSSMSGL